MSSGLVLVTGGAGAIGRRLIPELQDRDRRVRCLVHRRPIPEADEQVSLAGAVDGASHVLHLAAVTHARDPRRYAEVNVGLTARLLEAAEQAGVERFLYVSTHVLHASGGAYADSKRRAEELVREAGVPYVVIRLPEVYGAGGGEGLDRMIAAARAGRPIFVVGDGRYELRPLHVDEAIAALVAGLEAPAALGRTYTLAGPPLTMREAAEECRSQFGSSSRVVSVPEPLVRIVARAARVLPLPLFPDQLDRLLAPRPPASPEVEGELGIHPRAFPEGITLAERRG